MADERMDEELKQENAGQEQPDCEDACDTAAEPETEAEAEDGGQAEAADGDGKEKKGFFSKKKKEDPMKAQVSELQDKVCLLYTSGDTYRPGGAEPAGITEMIFRARDKTCPDLTLFMVFTEAKARKRRQWR